MQALCFHMNEVFANQNNKDEIYPIITVEIAAAQWADASPKHLFKRNAIIDQGLEIKLIENTTCVCKDGWLVISKPLPVHAVKWYHHYLQHPGHTSLEEMMDAAMFWKGMRTTIRSLTKFCRSCQINNRRSQKYGHLTPKTNYTIPWECLCVDLIGLYFLKGKDNLQIDCMALTMINPTSNWFEIAELPSITFNYFVTLLFTTPSAVVLSVCNGLECCLYSSVCWAGMGSLQLMWRAPISASAADDMTALMICKIVRITLLLLGIALSFDMKKCPPALLHTLVSKR
jgi:hypothetical protein